MATREVFIQELEGLNQELNVMSQMVQDAIDSSFQALTEHNEELAQKVIKGDRDVDNMERKIETHCLMLMLKQQPVASDLRHISTALKVVTDLERMGDQAADIADLSLRLEDADISLVSKHLPAMVANVKTMVKDAIHAFIERDTEMAETFEQRDDLIDAFFERVKREVIEFLKKDGDKSDVAVDLLMVAKYLERIADHAVNVCEWTEFSPAPRSSRSRANPSKSGCSGSTRRVRQENGIQPRRWCRKHLPRQLKIRQNLARRSCRQDRAATSDQDTVRRRNRQWVRRRRLDSKELKMRR